jgi:uncharacterized protein YuzE
MQIKYDKSVDALYITLKKGKVFKTKEQGGSMVDYDKKGELLGLEILNYSKKVRPLKGLVMGKLEGRVAG